MTETPKADNPATPAQPEKAAALQTYEDCKAAIDSSDNETNVDNLKATIRRLKSFFADRIDKKKRTTERGGFNSTREAITQRTGTFKKYEPKAIDANSSSPFSQ